MKSGVQVISDKTKRLSESLGALVKSKVLVGVPQKTSQRSDDPINNATIGYLMENGIPESNVPARPFLVPGVKNAQKEVTSIFRTATIASLSGDRASFVQGLNAAGIVAAESVRAKIETGPFAPLSPRTLQARERRKSKGGTKTIKYLNIQPLIDTGQLLRSITYIIRK